MLYKNLEDLAAAGKNVQIGIVGAGKMGNGLLAASSFVKGVKVVAMADVVPEKAISGLRSIGCPEEKISFVNDAEKGESAIGNEKVIVAENGDLLTEIKGIDVIIDATGKPDIGAKIALKSIINKKNIILLTDEADACVGPILNLLAKQSGIVYSGASGDEPGAIMELYDFARSLGFEIVAAGKGKNNPLNREATPIALDAEAKRKELSPRIYTSFVDGTNTMLEMTVVSNATGLIPDIRGMHGPTVNSVRELSHIFADRTGGGVLKQSGVVDFAIGGGVAPGVFLVVKTNNENVKKDLAYLGLGGGPTYTLHRPYHIPTMEPLLSAAKAVLYKDSSIAPIGHFSDTIAIAKRDIDKGEIIDGIGGSMIYGLIERTEIARKGNFVPISLLNEAVSKREIKKGKVLGYEDLSLKENEMLDLRKLQDKVCDRE